MNDMQLNGFHSEELEISRDDFHQNVLSKLNVLRQGQKFCDVKLVVEHHDVPAHKCILVSCSPYLFDMFSQEEESGVVRGSWKIRDVEFQSFQFLLSYMYTGKMVVPVQEVKGVYMTAKKLKMEEVSRKCASFMADNLTPLNCLEIRSYAQDIDMKNLVDEYIKCNVTEVIVSKNFYGLLNLQIEVVGADQGLLNPNQFSHLFDLVLIWVKDNLNSKKTKLDRLTEQLNVLYLTRDNTLQDCEDVEDSSLKEDNGIQDYRKLKRKQNGSTRSSMETNNNVSVPFQKFDIITEDTVIDKEWTIIAFYQTAENTHMSISILNGCLTTISLRCRVARLSPSNSIADLPDSPVHSASEIILERSRSLTPLNSMATPRCGFGLRSVNSKLIACGGYDRGECLNSTECFDLESNTWSCLADMKTTRGRFSAARVGNTIYACGGSNGHQELKTVEVYNAEKDVWSFVASMAKERSSPGVAVLDNKLFCIGGCMGQDSIAECEVYDPETNTWSFIASLNTARYQASVRAYHGRLYVMGGTDGWNCLNSVEVYDPKVKEWRFIEPLNVCRRGAGVECFQGELYVIGGNDGTHSLKSTEIFNVEEENWKFGPALTTPRSNGGSAVLGSRLFSVGGFNGKKFLDTAEYLDEFNEWTFYTPVFKSPDNLNSILSSSTDSLDNNDHHGGAPVIDDPIH